VETVTIRTPEELRRLGERLRNPGAVMQSAGLMLKRESDRAFDEQRMGEFEWPKRYPGQGEPFVNFAAVLQAANRGQEPNSERFFARTPALRGTGDLQKSVDWAVSGNEVTVGSRLGYAGLHQRGGESSFEVSDTARRVLRNWAFRGTTAQRLGVTAASFAAMQDPADTRKTRRRLPKAMDARTRKVFALSYLHRWSQKVIRRPFVGLTDRGQNRLREMVEHYAATGSV
jgi:phage gpG-like protein